MKDKKALTSYWYTCPECGKRFEVFGGEYLFKIGEKRFCSYKCLHSFKAKNKGYDTRNRILREIEQEKVRERIKEAELDLKVYKKMKDEGWIK